MVLRPEHDSSVKILWCLIYLHKDQLLWSHNKQETWKMEAGNLLPYSFETPTFHSNAIKISSQVKEARHLYTKTKCIQVMFLQEYEGRQLNTPCDKLALILSRFRVGSRPLFPQREAAVHLESVRGYQSCSPSRHQVLLPLSNTALI